VRIRKLLICLWAAVGAFLWGTKCDFAQSLYMSRASDLHCAFSDSAGILRGDGFTYPFFFTESDPQTGLSFNKTPLFLSYPLSERRQRLVVNVPPQNKINYKRASLLGTLNAGAIFFGFRQAIDSWGETKGRFHFKDDWNGDKLAQTDELSHFMWGYRMTQFLFHAYRWAGFSSNASHAISISQTAIVLTMVEYPIDAHNPEQGLGVSDLVFDYAGIGLACMKQHHGWLEDFDFKISWKKNIFLANQPVFAQSYEEFDNFIYWFTYRTKLFLPQKIFCFGLGYGVAHHDEESKRQLFAGIGLSLPDFASLFDERLKRQVGFLGLFYPNFSLKF
jgi:hypothetical protein